MLTSLAHSIVGGTDGLTQRQARSYQEARRQQREAARAAEERHLGWQGVQARAAGAYLARNMKKLAHNESSLDEVRDGD